MHRKLENKVVLVTGGAGFIGSNICHRLVEQGNQVICFDNLITGFRSNIESLETASNFRFLEADITDREACLNATKGVDAILHQGALGSVPRSIELPQDSHQTNATGFLNMLEAARVNGVKRFVYASSSSVFGDSKTLPKKEQDIGNPLSPYAVTKYTNELYAKVYSDLHGIETIGLRYFNVFGRRQSPKGAYAAAIPKFVQAFIQHRSPTIHGDGTQSRDFTYIENVIQINELAATTTNPEAMGTVFNVACGTAMQVGDLVEKIRELLVKFDPKIASVKIEHGPERKGDVRHSMASIAKAQNLLGYRPSHTADQGLEEAIEWYHENLG